MGNPTNLATFTIIAALLPMGWVSGLMGPYMRPIPVLGASAMFFSLVAAFVFTPWFALRVRPRMAALEKAERREEKTRRLVSRAYRPLVIPLIQNRKLGILFLIGVIAVTALVCVLFYTKTVAVKMLPFDNKPEFSVVVNMPEGTALPETANVIRQLAQKVKGIPEVVAIQGYAGTAQPFNFNGMVRHYYLRQRPWEGDLLVMLKDKNERERGSHEIAVAARALLTPLAQRMGAKIAVVEMPPGPPVLQTVVAEIYGPTAETRRQVAADMTRMFEQVENIVDVDNYMAEPYEYWRFEVDTEKAVRRGISVDTINQNLSMAMGGFRVGDIKRGTVLEPTYIVMQVPLAYRAQINSLGSLPIGSASGNTVLLAELGQFVREEEDPIIYHKDLRPMEYVVGEMQGRLGAPIYGMFGVEDLLEDYTAPDGVKITGMPMGLIGPPAHDSESGFEWSGEWTVTYETFRDMGLAFMAALVLIYGLIVWEFRNFALAGLIMSPIPLTLIGIIPGHLIMGAEFTATSMIGMIALGGIIVRQSILIVEFVKIEVAKGKSVREAAVAGAEIRMRPIFITSLTLMAGAWAIINDPIFQGMAVSLLFGAGVATVMAVIVIPLGCISARKQFYLEETESGDIELSGRYSEVEEVATAKPAAGGLPLWMRVYSGLVTTLFWTFQVLRAISILIWTGLNALYNRFVRKPKGPPPVGPAGYTPPSGTTPPSGAGPGAAGPGAAPPGGSAAGGVNGARPAPAGAVAKPAAATANTGGSRAQPATADEAGQPASPEPAQAPRRRTQSGRTAGGTKAKPRGRRTAKAVEKEPASGAGAKPAREQRRSAKATAPTTQKTPPTRKTRAKSTPAASAVSQEPAVAPRAPGARSRGPSAQQAADGATEHERGAQGAAGSRNSGTTAPSRRPRSTSGRGSVSRQASPARGNGEAGVPTNATAAPKRVEGGSNADPVAKPKHSTPGDDQFPMPEPEEAGKLKEFETAKQPSGRRSRRGIRLKNGVQI